jgi:hypothetical protein
MICPNCSAPRPAVLWSTGVLYDLDGITPLSVAYKCKCGNNRGVPWPAATQEQREQADLAQLSLDAANEMMGI